MPPYSNKYSQVKATSILTQGDRATIEKARQIVEQAGTGWDLQELKRQFTHAVIKGSFTPENVNAAFVGFVKKKAAACP
jgi:CYTH domain-containing protein